MKMYKRHFDVDIYIIGENLIGNPNMFVGIVLFGMVMIKKINQMIMSAILNSV